MSRRFCFLLCVVLLQTSCGSPRSEGPSSDQTTAPTQANTHIGELQGKITKWQSNRDKLKQLLEQMQKDKAGILERLVQLGIKSEADLANNPKGQVFSGELKDIMKQMSLYDKKFQDYDLAIFKSESRVRTIARQLSAKEAGISDTELEELTRSMVTLDESLASEKEPAVPIDLKDTLKDELAQYRQGPKAAPLSPKFGTNEKLATALEEVPSTGKQGVSKLSIRPGGIIKPGNVALASSGTTVEGEVKHPSAINDGRVNEKWDERAKAPLHKPITLVFPEVYRLGSIRIKLSDGSQWQEYYQYTLEASSDGETYEMLEDRTKGEWRGWQDIEFSPRPVKSIRLTGTEDHPNHTGIRIYEIEAYCPSSEQVSHAEKPIISSPVENTSTSSTHVILKGALLVLTFDDSTLRRKNEVLTAVSDLSGRGVVGEVTNVSVVEGKVGKGLKFGNSSYMEIKGDFPAGKEPRTIVVWLRAEPHARVAITQGEKRRNEAFGIIANGTWRFEDPAELDTKLQVDEAWHHHAITYDGQEICYYFDARLVATKRKELQTASSPLVIGAWPGNVSNFHGVIDEVALFNRALSPNEVEQVYQLGVDGISLSTSGH